MTTASEDPAGLPSLVIAHLDANEATKFPASMMSPLLTRALMVPGRAPSHLSGRIASGGLRTPWTLQIARQQPGVVGASQKVKTISQRMLIATESVPKLSKLRDSVKTNPMNWWLFGTAGLVATTLTVGAAARLTRSGVSMLYWKPHGLLAPSNERDWMKEFDIYRDFCFHHQRQPMHFEDFQRNYKWEAAHRLLGQTSMLAFLGPLGYFYTKKMIPIWMQAPLALVTALGTTQMFVGRRMVRMNLLEDEARRHKEGEFLATFGLPVHEVLSLANFSLLVWTGLSLMSPTSRAIKLRELTMSSALRDIGEVRKYMQWATGVLAGTIVAGTLVAEIDAGKEFNTFPKMGDHWIPGGLFELSPWTRNLYDNVAQVQLNHRLLAVGTIAAYTAIYMKARKPNVWPNLPEESKTAMNATMAAVGGQLAFGVTMLVNSVPTTLSLVHQGGAALVLGSSLWALHTLRFARPGGIIGAAKIATKVL